MNRTAAALTAGALLVMGACAPVDARTADDAATLVERWQARSGAPAVVAAIDQPAHGMQVFAAGTRHRGGPPVRANARFRIASITKMFVGAVVLQLVDEGRVAIDEPASRYLPAIEIPREVTVRQLLNHTSGIPDYASVPGLGQRLLDDRTHRWTTAEVLATVANLRPEFAPGQGYAYSNTDYVLIGQLIESVTGDTWADQVRDRIIEPLELTATTIPSHGEPPARVVPGYFDADNDGDTENVETGAWPSLETSEGPAGAIVSTVADVTRATRAILDGTLLPTPLVALMTSSGPHDRRYDGYGLGVELAYPDRRTLVVGHGGFLPGSRTVTWHVLDHDIVITVLANESRVDPTDLAELLLRHTTDL
ncbi:MAG TPA: serine hydrolase domain-containing protein [Nitriliruptorales bacterium]|nr:serine hydrolase domain-containing protein [Nitriliruptorales bacterium]